MSEEKIEKGKSKFWNKIFYYNLFGIFLAIVGFLGDLNRDKYEEWRFQKTASILMLLVLLAIISWKLDKSSKGRSKQ